MSVNLVIRKEDDTIVSKAVDNSALSECITNLKLYEKDLGFIDEYSSRFPDADIFPLDYGILVIDLKEDIIYDSQGVTGVNKISPAEIKMSRNGNIVGETKDSSIIHRFKTLVESGRLKGFEEWYDNGAGLNTNVLKMDYETLLETTLETNIYGQFVFSTTPFKVQSYCETDKVEQNKMFQLLSKHGIVKPECFEKWNLFIKELK